VDERQIRAFRFSPNGDQLAVGGGEGDVVIWDLATRQRKTFHAHQNPVTALQFSPGGNELITGSSDGSMKLWDLATQEEIPNHWKGHLGPVTALSFSRDERWVASGGRDRTIKLWRRAPDQPVAPDEIKGLNSKAYGNFAFSPDGKSIAAGFKDRSVKILDAGTLTTNLVLTGMLYVVAFTTDSRHLLASGPGDVAYLWDLEKKVVQPLSAYAGQIESIICVDFSPDRKLAALGLEGGTIDIVDLQSGRRIGSLYGHSGPVRTLRFSSVGTLLVSGGSDRFVRRWDVKHLALLWRSQDKHRGAVCAAAISQNGKLVASGCGFGTIKLWASDNFSNAVTTIVGHASALRSLAFSHDGKTLASGAEDRVVKFWNVAALSLETFPFLRREVAELPVSGKVRLVEFSPDDNTLAVITDDGVLRLLRAVTLPEADAETIANGE
jgi:WD40 repeat protein